MNFTPRFDSTCITPSGTEKLSHEPGTLNTSLTMPCNHFFLLLLHTLTLSPFVNFISVKVCLCGIVQDVFNVPGTW